MGHPARHLRHPRVKHQARRHILPARLGKRLGPDILRIGQHSGDKLADIVIRRHRSLLRSRCGYLLVHAQVLDQPQRVGSREKREGQDQDQTQPATDHGATRRTHPATIFDLLALSLRPSQRMPALINAGKADRKHGRGPKSG